ncbi:unnamed protein product [Cutaneotrichosporon oleaginosum]
MLPPRPLARLWRRLLAWVRDAPVPSREGEPKREDGPIPIPPTLLIEHIATPAELAAYANEVRNRGREDEEDEDEDEEHGLTNRAMHERTEKEARPSESLEHARGPRPPPRNKSSRALRVSL